MLKFRKTVSAVAAGLIATAGIAQPAAAQSAYESWYAQGGYDENAPYGYNDQGYDQGYDQGLDQGGDPAYGNYDPGYDPANQPGAYGPAYDGYAQSAYNDREYFAYQRECRRQRANNQVGGAIAGALIGGLFGNAVSRRRSRGPATVFGAFAGGMIGAGVAGNMDCGDHYYAQRVYYDGFERRAPRTGYRWQNPDSGNYGDFYVGDYYQGPRGEDCATYSQTVWIHGRPEEARGYACRRYDGTWDIVS